jgi:hypothetical protein
MILPPAEIGRGPVAIGSPDGCGPIAGDLVHEFGGARWLRVVGVDEDGEAS